MQCSAALSALALLLAVAASAAQATPRCKNCVLRGKDERLMFRAHSDACLATSGAAPTDVDALLAGAHLDAPALRRHVHCILLRCKVIAKDGKLQKAAVLGKLARKNAATKALENCFEQTGETPEDLAWNLFKCGYDKKSVLFEYMPNTNPSSGENEDH